MNQTAFAELFGVDQSTVSRWEKGADMKPEHYQKMLDMLIAKKRERDEGESTAERELRHHTIPVRGYVGGGAVILDLGNDTPEIGYVEEPRRSPEMVAVLVKGDSMYPAYRDGDVIYFSEFNEPPSRLLGLECLVMTGDGRRMVKILEKGSEPGLFNLTSYNAPTIHDQRVTEAYPVTFVKRKKYA